MKDWNKVSAIAALGCLGIAAVTFAIQIWPVPQIRTYYGNVTAAPLGGSKFIAMLIVAGFVLAGIAIYGAWRKPRPQNDRLDAFRNPHWEIVSGHTYVNKSIEIDGKSFRDCTFANVTFTFRGNAPTEFVGNSKFSGGLSFDTDNPAIMLFTKLQRIFRAIPGARIQEGELDEKGNLLKDKFEIVEVSPIGTIPQAADKPANLLPTDPRINSEVTDSDPRIYLLEIK